MTEDKPARPGSARAKLEQFERQNKGKEAMMKKLLIILGLLMVALVIQFFIVKSSDSNDYFQFPKNAAWMAREGKWDDLRKLCTDDFKVEGLSANSADDFVGLVSGYGQSGVNAFATVPHRWEKIGEGAKIEFWVIWARGDLKNPATIPLSKMWLVDATLVSFDDAWHFKRAKIRPILLDSEKTSVDLSNIIDRK